VIRPWRTLSRRVLLERPPWLVVGEERVELPNGEIIESFSFIDSRDFAISVAITGDDRIVVVRSYKHGVRDVALSFPAGYVEDGEDPLAAAKRELREESGYEADSWLALGRYVVDGNYGNGRMHAFLARGARRVTEPASGDHEEQELLLVPFAEAVDALRQGEIHQLSTAGALGLAALALGRR